MANTKITNPELFNLGDSTSATQLPVMTTAQRIAMNAPPSLTVDYLVVAGGGGGGGGSLTTFVPDVDTSGIVTSGWQILMATNGLKSGETTSDPFARIGTTGFRGANFQSSGAISRTAFGAGRGVYANFFLKNSITKNRQSVRINY